MWNDLEIRVVGQTYTVVRNGVVINEYENVPGVPFPSRPNDADSSSRGLVGSIVLQAHGAPQDVVSFREIRIKDLSNRDPWAYPASAGTSRPADRWRSRSVPTAPSQISVNATKTPVSRSPP